MRLVLSFSGNACPQIEHLFIGRYSAPGLREIRVVRYSINSRAPDYFIFRRDWTPDSILDAASLSGVRTPGPVSSSVSFGSYGGVVCTDVLRVYIYIYIYIYISSNRLVVTSTRNRHIDQKPGTLIFKVFSLGKSGNSLDRAPF